MAREIVAFCDNHGDERVPGTTRRFDLGSGPSELELCDPCQKAITLGELADVLGAWGRPVGPEAEGKAKFRCTWCPMTRATLRGLADHINTSHPDDLSTLIAVLVGKSVEDAVGPKPKPKAAKDGRQELLVCSECGQQCGGPQGLAAHSRWHQAKDVTCPDCGRTMKAPSLAHHRSVRHNEPISKRAREAR